MNVSKLRSVRIVLLIAAVLAFISGMPKAVKAGKEAASDVTKIKVEILDKKCYSKSDNSFTGTKYYIDFTVQLSNNTDVDWYYLAVQTDVFNSKGEKIGTVTSSFGSNWGPGNGNSFLLEEDKTATQVVTIEKKESEIDDFFVALVNSELSDLRFESAVVSGYHND